MVNAKDEDHENIGIQDEGAPEEFEEEEEEDEEEQVQPPPPPPKSKSKSRSKKGNITHLLLKFL